MESEACAFGSRFFSPSVVAATSIAPISFCSRGASILTPQFPPEFALHAAFRRSLLSSSSLISIAYLMATLSTESAKDKPFVASAAIAARYRFVTPGELQSALERFCDDIEIHDDASIAILTARKVHHSTLKEFSRIRNYYAPHPGADPNGIAARQFMAAEAMTLLLGFDHVVMPLASDVPLVNQVMIQGAEGLFQVGRPQFEILAQFCVDLVDWLHRTGRHDFVLIESPLGNSVPVAVLQRVAQDKGLRAAIVEWGCPRNDRASNGPTVTDSARALAKDPVIQSAPFILFVDDAISGSRFLKMSKALRRAVGHERFGAVGMRFRYPPEAGLRAAPVRDLEAIQNWATELGMPFGEVIFPDLPLFDIDDGGKALLKTALCWGDAALVAGKRKSNIVFIFIDRFEAIAVRLRAGDSQYRQFLTQRLWSQEVDGRVFINRDDIAKQCFDTIFDAAPPDLFDRIRAVARDTFPDDYLGRRVLNTPDDLKMRTDWLAQCVFTVAKDCLSEKQAHFLNRAIQDLSNAGLSADVDAAPRDHVYGQYTIPLPQGEHRLHDHLITLILAETATRSPRRLPVG